jgi:hypothetical protein
MRVLILALSLLFVDCNCVLAFDFVTHERVAVSVVALRFYQDSSFALPTNFNYPEGHLFEILDETLAEYPDNAFDQTFKWYHLKALDGNSGWVLGDAVAITVPVSMLDEVWTHVHKSQGTFNNGFDEALLWIGMIEGHDNFYPEAVRNPQYREFYLVASTAQGKCASVPIGISSTQGRTRVKRFWQRDLTGDGAPELIFEMAAKSPNNPVEVCKIEVYSFQSGALTRLFDEKLTLLIDDKLPAPSVCKTINFDGDIIRIGYVQYDEGVEQTVRYITSSYMWDNRLKEFKVLYPESKKELVAHMKTITPLMSSTAIDGKILGLLEYKTEARLQKVVERTVRFQNKDVVEALGYVLLADGSNGWVSMRDVSVQAEEYSQLLETYYAKPPVNKNDWMTTQEFVFFD